MLNHTEDFIVAWVPQHKCSCGSQDSTDLGISCMEMLWGARAFLALVSLKLGLDQKGIDSNEPESWVSFLLTNQVLMLISASSGHLPMYFMVW